VGGFLVTQSLADNHLDGSSFVLGELGETLGDFVAEFIGVEGIPALGRLVGTVGKTAVIGFEESLKALIPVVSTLDEIVGNLDEVTHRDLHLWKAFDLKKACKDVLSDVFRHVRGKRTPAEAVHAVVRRLEEVQYD